MDEIIDVLPVERVKGFSNPLRSILANSLRADAVRTAAITKSVNGSTFTGYKAFNDRVFLNLSTGDEIRIIVTNGRRSCEISFNDLDTDQPANYENTFGEQCVINWPRLGFRTWSRAKLLNAMIGRKIVRIAAHQFGTSIYMNGPYHIMFSPLVDARKNISFLFWCEEST